MASRRKPRPRNKPAKTVCVAVCIDTREQWGRERLFGFLQYAQMRNWQIHRIQENNKAALAEAAPRAFDGAVVYDCLDEQFQALLKKKSSICVELGLRNQHLTDASVFLDDAAVVRMQIEHLRSIGFEQFALCGFSQNRVSDIRENHFFKQTDGAGHVFKDAILDGVMDIDPLIRWLKSLPKPIGVLTCDDRGGEHVLAACLRAGIHVPEEVGVVGLGNDELICEMTQPCLSSVVVPSQRLGWGAAELIEQSILGKKIKKKRQPLAPLDVVSRTSTDRLLAARPLVLKAATFMRAESSRPIGVDQVVAAAGVSRSTLERAFVADIGRTVHEYFVQLRMEAAKQLLRKTNMPIIDVAAQSGYLSLSAFVQMFTTYVGMSPRDYRHHQQPLMRATPTAARS